MGLLDRLLWGLLATLPHHLAAYWRTYREAKLGRWFYDPRRPWGTRWVQGPCPSITDHVVHEGDVAVESGIPLWVIRQHNDFVREHQIRPCPCEVYPRSTS